MSVALSCDVTTALPVRGSITKFSGAKRGHFPQPIQRASSTVISASVIAIVVGSSLEFADGVFISDDVDVVTDGSYDGVVLLCSVSLVQPLSVGAASVMRKEDKEIFLRSVIVFLFIIVIIIISVSYSIIRR